MRKIIIDTDPGIDDAFAIIAALKYEGFDVLGITSVGGNKGLDLTTKNSEKMVEFMNADCKVYRGLDTPLDDTNKKKFTNYTEHTDEIHGADGLGNVDLSYDPNISLGDISAIEFILKMAKEYKGELEIITLGPLTNIATCIKEDPDTMKGIKNIYSMGGGIKTGNCTEFAEFNYYFDPLAAKVVYDFGHFIDITMIGLNVTHKCIFTIEDIFFIGEELGETGKLLSHMANVYIRAYWRENKYKGCVIHDLLTVLYAIDNTLCPVKEKVNLDVVLAGLHSGETVMDKTSKIKNAYVPLDIKTVDMKNLFVKLIDENKLELYKKYFN